jgi:transcriptional regulator with XRE-family HTH domain
LTKREETLDGAAVGRRIKTAFGGKKNAEIARLLGISESAVSNYVSGRVPDAQTLLRICNLTNCNAHWLLTGEELTPAPPESRPMDLEESLRTVIRQVVREEISTLQPVKELGTVDAYDIEAGVKKYDNALPVLIEWYAHDHKPAPNLSALAFSGWDKMTLDQKVREVRNLRHSIDEDVEFERQARDALARKSKTS